MSEDRRLMVLRAIVQDYVATSEPVGSKALVERHQLGVSAATVRNDMALLEEEGLIHAPHTSAGRVPTDAGYRVFVDRLSAVKPLGPGERRAISQFLEGAVDLDDVVDRTVRLLASLTRQVAVVQYPSLTRSTVRHIELVPLGADAPHDRAHRQHRPGRAAGRRPRPRARRRRRRGARRRDPLPHQRGRRRGALHRRRDPAAPPRPDAEGPDEADRGRDGGGRLGARSTPSSRSARSGSCSPASPTSRVPAPTSRAPSGRSSRPSRSTSTLLRLLGQLSDDPDLVSVRIGAENPVTGLQSTSLVSMGYGSGAERVASLGVLGPTRMDYPTTMASVRAVARYVSEILDANEST